MQGESMSGSLWRTLAPVDRRRTVVYVMLSLASALAGAVAALLFVPLVQPGQVWTLAGITITGNDTDTQATVFALVATVFAVTRWQAARLGARLVGDYGVTLRRLVHARLVDAPLGSLAGSGSAEIANVLTYNVEIVVQAFSAFQQLLVAGLTAAASMFVAFVISPPLVLASPVLAFFAWLASRLFGREQVAIGRRYVADMTSLFWHSEDFPRRLRHVRSFGRQAAEKASYEATSSRLGDGYAQQLQLIASGRLVLELVAVGGMAGMFVLAHRWHRVDPASLIAVCLLFGRLLPYVVSTRQSFQQLRSAAPALALWRRYASIAPEASVEESAAEPGIVRIERLRVVPPVQGTTVSDLMLVPGELVLIGGDSGIGKSSLVDVLAGMAPPEHFTASLDGHPIGFDRYRALVRRGAYLGQSMRPWQRTVGECLRWAAPAADDATLRAVLNEVGLAMPLDACLQGETGRLSGGESQRLMLAQVILRQPVLALLDEATSALDTVAELTLLATLKRRLPRTILVVVSHRPGVAMLAERVLTLGARHPVRPIVPSRGSA